MSPFLSSFVVPRSKALTLVVAVAVTAAGLLGSMGVTTGAARVQPQWSSAELEMLRSLSLAALESLPPDPSNAHGDDPRAAALGRELFFDTRLSGNGQVSCATCHAPAQQFQDGRPLARGMGTTARRTMPVAGTSYSPWMFWDGRMDSQWSQALGPLESAVEHRGTRAQYAHVVADHYRTEYQAVFGALPDLAGVSHRAGPVADSAASEAWRRIAPVRRDEISRVYANIGKAIAAYERRIRVSSSRFDAYVAVQVGRAPSTAENSFSSDEEAGLKLFIGRANCVNCHNGALFTDNHFHNTGVPTSNAVAGVDSGRATGVRQALAGEFNCTSKYSDAKPEQCEELRFAVTSGPELVRAYKTPSLRNVADRAPYMHAGQLASLDAVLEHYSSAPAAPFGRSELKPLHLSTTQRQQLAAFLRTLSAPLSAPPGFLESPVARR